MQCFSDPSFILHNVPIIRLVHFPSHVAAFSNNLRCFVLSRKQLDAFGKAENASSE